MKTNIQPPTRYRLRALTVRYGLFCDKSSTPAAAFYTQFAARKKCRELNLRASGSQWSVRELD